ncbi:hypothetical protein BSU04_33915 [Caballeronia sordidicola]|uniref:Uncharacterized protein n=1 Tax=Caballeronia sordidicola TaxID=196367 RepID=A0A226WSG6_CABSO|nr:hypothetical protein BSU04_33915 [Caballeronia sordidicola]
MADSAGKFVGKIRLEESGALRWEDPVRGFARFQIRATR